MIKANSPICAIEKPLCMASLRLQPESRKPTEPKMACPTRMASVMMTIGSQYSRSTAGSTSMPTDTKKTAPNMSFTGLMSFSIMSASRVSAKMLPIMKAPNAAL